MGACEIQESPPEHYESDQAPLLHCQGGLSSDV